MNRLNRLRNNVKRLIDKNPTWIVVTRTTRVKGIDGGFTDSDATLDPMKVRLSGRRIMTIGSTEAGKIDIVRAQLLCDWCVNLQRSTPTNTDKFEIDGDTFRILDVKTFKEDMKIYQKIAEVELID